MPTFSFLKEKVGASNPFKLRDKEAVGGVGIGKKCDVAVLYLVLSNKEGNKAEILVIFKETLDVALVFLGEYSAGGINESAAYLYVSAGIFKYCKLYVGKRLGLLGVFIPKLGLLLKNSKARTGYVAKHSVCAPLKLREKSSSIALGDAYYIYSQSFCSRYYKRKLFCVKVKGEDATLVLHRYSRSEAF